MAQARTIEDAWRASRERGNNFDAVRLVAATAVLISHSFYLGTGRHEREFIPPLAGGVGLGELAVFVFFSASGFLITKSWLVEPALHRFFLKRAARIFPALIFVVFALTFIIGPLISNWAPAKYFGSGETWAFVLNIVFMSQHATLPGVFESNPAPDRVDNSLWTLGFEAVCYLAVAILGAIRALRWQTLLAIALSLIAIGSIDGLRQSGAVGDALFKLTLVGPHFFVGAASAILADKIRLDAPAALGSLAMLTGAGAFGGFVFAFSVFGTYLVLYLAFAALGPVRNAGRFGDFSYGIYLWGWPAQQIVQEFIRPAGWLGNLAFGLSLAILFAVVSWRLVERPALALKSGIGGRATAAPSLNFRNRNPARAKALPGRPEAAIRIQNHG